MSRVRRVAGLNNRVPGAVLVFEGGQRSPWDCSRSTLAILSRTACPGCETLFQTGGLVVCGAPRTKESCHGPGGVRADGAPRPFPAEGRRLGGGAIASLSGVGLLLIFMIPNAERVRLDFLFWKFTWPLWLLTMASALLGALV